MGEFFKHGSPDGKELVIPMSSKQLQQTTWQLFYLFVVILRADQTFFSK